MFLLLKELLALVIICEIVSAVDDSSLDYVKLITSELAKAMAYKERVNNEDLYPKSASGDIKDFGDFEFIVVGAGTAGSLVANKLAGSKLKTLLIEAGGDETKFTDIPAMFRQLQFSDKNWGYYTTPQEHACQGMINKQCAFPRGKVMGGTSTIGGLTYARGSQVDQDLWSEYDIGNWSWRSVLPYYIDLENYSPIGLDQLGDGTSYHGFKGSMPIDFARPANSLENIFLAANEQVYDVTKDINGPSYMAAGKVQFMKKNGRRISSAKAFLKSFNSKFLTITKLSYAYKILLNNYRMAEGVLFMKDGQRYRARASHEVILSGGSINTPHLLMLSGIGPKAELAMHGIPLVKDLPVGKNLVGHVGFHGLQFESKLKLYDRNKKFAEQISEYQAGTGALANVAIDGMAYVSTTKDKDNPDLEVFISSRGALNVTANNEWHFTEDTLAEFSLPNEALEYVFRIAILVIKAHSKGEVTLKSADPTAFPNINTNSLSDPRDIKTIYKGIKYILKLLESDAFKNINANLLKRVLPDCRQHEYLSQEYWTCMIRHVSGTANHPVGTCRIGEGKEGVVDTNLRVKGVGSLRVIDLSVAPRVNSLHTNALALVIGSKGADFVIESYRMKDDNEL